MTYKPTTYTHVEGPFFKRTDDDQPKPQLYTRCTCMCHTPGILLKHCQPCCDHGYNPMYVT